MRVLGIDPGFGRCGIAVMDDSFGSPTLLFSTCIETKASVPFSKRMLEIANEIHRILQEFRPDEIALEEVFFSRNQKTVIHVAEIRGMILYLAAKRSTPISEYNPGRVKISVTGDGRADKEQVKQMVRRILRMDGKERLDDEYDAIALSIAHLSEYRSRQS
jgi:crossover junction endodeoxyribonuclease RuvC